MKNLALVLLSISVISVPTYAQPGAIDTVLKTIQVIQDINDMLGNNSRGSDYDDYYDNYGYDNYSNPPSHPEYGYMRRPHQPYPKPRGGYDVPRHRVGYPNESHGRMGQPSIGNHDHLDGMIDRPAHQAIHERPQMGTDAKNGRNQGFFGGNRDSSLTRPNADNYQDNSFRRDDRNYPNHQNQRIENVFSSRQTNIPHQGRIFDGNNRIGGFPSGNHNNSQQHGGIFDKNHQNESHGSMFGNNHYGRHSDNHSRFGGKHRGRH